MARNRIPLWIALPIIGVGALVAFVMGLFAYMSLTATPLHQDAQAIPSVWRSAPPDAWASAAERGRQAARTALVDQNLPGLSVAVGVAGDVVWAEGFGWADLELRNPVTPETRFRTGEVSKALTSAAVGLLLEKNELQLDAEIQTYVPEFPKKEWRVTLRHLMGDVAGLRDDPGDEAPLANVLDDDGLPNLRCDRTVDALKLFADGALRFEPGTRHHPSTYGWILVSAAVDAAASGQSFFTFMRAQVFEPLGMRSTRPDSAAEQVPERATFYFPRFAGDPRYGPDPAREGDHSCFAGGGAFLSTPSDLVRFGMGINSGTLLKAETVRLLQTPLRLTSGEETGYGLGWKLETLPLAGEAARMAGHGVKGDFIGGSAYLMTFPERGLAVAVMTNISFADTKSIALRLAESFAEQGSSPPN
ncbi:MAG TPA: serine hydrolase domain-containing protein [Vicinamibacterales bacterium]|nr:serine hydrolase domain-containing protein [Vicinamibacterales bacterium]